MWEGEMWRRNVLNPSPGRYCVLYAQRLSAARDGPLICQLPGRSLLLLTPDLACPNSNRRWVGCV